MTDTGYPKILESLEELLDQTRLNPPFDLTIMGLTITAWQTNCRRKRRGSYHGLVG